MQQCVSLRRPEQAQRKQGSKRPWWCQKSGGENLQKLKLLHEVIYYTFYNISKRTLTVHFNASMT